MVYFYIAYVIIADMSIIFRAEGNQNLLELLLLHRYCDGTFDIKIYILNVGVYLMCIAYNMKVLSQQRIIERYVYVRQTQMEHYVNNTFEVLFVTYKMAITRIIIDLIFYCVNEIRNKMILNVTKICDIEINILSTYTILCLMMVVLNKCINNIKIVYWCIVTLLIIVEYVICNYSIVNAVRYNFIFKLLLIVVLVITSRMLDRKKDIY